MSPSFPVFDIPFEAPEDIENIGTKEKFWFNHQNFGLCLFKKARPGTGEDWSEKTAAELCQLLQIPHADYELATFNEERGVISPSFIPPNGNLSLGNEILFQTATNYPKHQNSPSEHTVHRVVDTLQKLPLELPLNGESPPGIQSAADLFIGYLLLDAWIGNTDRHHENWGVIQFEGKLFLAPTYDHASSLGRNLTDTERSARLTTKDKGYAVEAFVHKGRSCLYRRQTDKKALKIHEAFEESAKICPNAAKIWLDLLGQINSNDTLTLLQQIPNELASDAGINFAHRCLAINQQILLKSP